MTGTSMSFSRGRRSSTRSCAAKSRRDPRVAAAGLEGEPIRHGFLDDTHPPHVGLLVGGELLRRLTVELRARLLPERAPVARHALSPREHRQAIDGNDAGDEIGVIRGEGHAQRAAQAVTDEHRLLELACLDQGAQILREGFERRARHRRAAIEARQRQ